MLVLLGTVLNDGLVELTVMRYIAVTEQVVPVGESTLLGGLIGEQDIEVRDSIKVVLKGDAIVLEASLGLLGQEPLEDSVLELLELSWGAILVLDQVGYDDSPELGS